MKFLKRFFISILVLFAVLYVWGKIYSIEPALVNRPIVADSIRIKQHLYYLTNQCIYRNYHFPAQLEKSATYIKQQFDTVSNNVSIQPYDVNGLPFKNVICSMGPRDGERIIIGAHYDACLDQPGADDNASGVSALLELARLLKDKPLKYRIDFVAYSTEEPPFFGTKNMGSYVHAKSLNDSGVKVKGLVCLETMGVFFDEPNTQGYLVFLLEWFYGNKGNFITVAQKYPNGEFGSFISKRMKQEQVIPTKSFSAPQGVAGVDLSDQINYWKFGYSAVMITNTAFYRDKYYHTILDMPGRINCQKLALVVDELYHTILDIN